METLKGKATVLPRQSKTSQNQNSNSNQHVQAHLKTPAVSKASYIQELTHSDEINASKLAKAPNTQFPQSVKTAKSSQSVHTTQSVPPTYSAQQAVSYKASPIHELTLSTEENVLIAQAAQAQSDQSVQTTQSIQSVHPAYSDSDQQTVDYRISPIQDLKHSTTGNDALIAQAAQAQPDQSIQTTQSTLSASNPSVQSDVLVDSDIHIEIENFKVNTNQAFGAHNSGTVASGTGADAWEQSRSVLGPFSDKGTGKYKTKAELEVMCYGTIVCCASAENSTHSAQQTVSYKERPIPELKHSTEENDTQPAQAQSTLSVQPTNSAQQAVSYKESLIPELKHSTAVNDVLIAQSSQVQSSQSTQPAYSVLDAFSYKVAGNGKDKAKAESLYTGTVVIDAGTDGVAHGRPMLGSFSDKIADKDKDKANAKLEVMCAGTVTSGAGAEDVARGWAVLEVEAGIVSDAWNWPVFLSVRSKQELICCIDSGIDLSHCDISGLNDLSYVFYKRNLHQARWQQIKHWDTHNVQNFSHMFEGSNLGSIDLATWNMQSALDLSYMFCDCSRFNADLNSWNVSGVKSLAHTFHNAASFNGDISNWDTHNVLTMESLLQGASKFNGDLRGWKISQVINWNHAFAQTPNFCKLGATLKEWHFDAARSVRFMLAHTQTKIPDILVFPQAFSLEGLFYHCKHSVRSLKHLYAPMARNLAWAFAGCDSVNTHLNIVCPQAQRLDYMFADIPDLNLLASNFWQLGKIGHNLVGNCNAQRNLASGFTLDFTSQVWFPILELDATFNLEPILIPSLGSGLSNFAETSTKIKAQANKAGAGADEGADYVADKVDDDDVADKIAADDNDKAWTVAGAWTLDGIWPKAITWAKAVARGWAGTDTGTGIKTKTEPDEDESVVTFASKSGYNFGYESDGSPKGSPKLNHNCGHYDHKSGYDLSYTYGYLRLVSDGSSSLSDWGGFTSAYVGSNSGCVCSSSGCVSFAFDYVGSSSGGLAPAFGDVDAWCVKSARPMTMVGMFQGVKRLQANFQNWDVSAVTDMAYMFKNSGFTQGLSSWRPINVTNMREMFAGACKFNDDLSHWSVEKACNLERMFFRTQDFKGNLSNWHIQPQANTHYMFKDSGILNGNLPDIGRTNFSDRSELTGQAKYKYCKKRIDKIDQAKLTVMQAFHHAFSQTHAQTFQAFQASQTSPVTQAVQIPRASQVPLVGFTPGAKESSSELSQAQSGSDLPSEGMTGLLSDMVNVLQQSTQHHLEHFNPSLPESTLKTSAVDSSSFSSSTPQKRRKNTKDDTLPQPKSAAWAHRL